MISSPLTGKGLLTFSLFKTQAISNHVLTATVSITHNHENIVWLSPTIRIETRNRLDWTHVFQNQRISMQLAQVIFLQKNFYGTGHRLENNIKAVFFLRRQISNGLTEHTYQTIRKTLRNSLISPTMITAVETEYLVLLDGLDVSDKIESCTINYSMDSFAADIDIQWADPGMYSTVDCSNIASNYMLERVAVYTRLKSNEDPIWVMQGKFFLEKRSTSVVFGKTTVSSWGRNRPAVLDLPYAKPLTKVWSETTTAKAVAQELCDDADLPVNLSWEIMDYRILGSNLDVEGEQPINIISTLASVVGGILTCAKDGTLRVIYRYHEEGVPSYSPQAPDPAQILGVVGGDGQATVYFA